MMSERLNETEHSESKTTVYNIQIPNNALQNGNVIRLTQSDNQTRQSNTGGSELKISLSIRNSGLLRSRSTGNTFDGRNINQNAVSRTENSTEQTHNHETNDATYNYLNQRSSLQYVRLPTDNWTMTPPQVPLDWENTFSQLRRQWSDHSRRNSFFTRLRPHSADPMKRGSEDHLCPCFPTSGEVRAMFGMNSVSDRPEYATSATIQDPPDWRPEVLDNLYDPRQETSRWVSSLRSEELRNRNISPNANVHEQIQSSFYKSPCILCLLENRFCRDSDQTSVDADPQRDNKSKDYVGENNYESIPPSVPEITSSARSQENGNVLQIEHQQPSDVGRKEISTSGIQFHADRSRTPETHKVYESRFNVPERLPQANVTNGKSFRTSVHLQIGNSNFPDNSSKSFVNNISPKQASRSYDENDRILESKQIIAEMNGKQDDYKSDGTMPIPTDIRSLNIIDENDTGKIITNPMKEQSRQMDMEQLIQDIDIEISRISKEISNSEEELSRQMEIDQLNEDIRRIILRNAVQQDPTRMHSRIEDEVSSRDISRNISQQDPTRMQSRIGDEVSSRDISRNISQQDPTRMQSRIGDEVSSRDISRDISQQDPTRMHSRTGDEVLSRDISRNISQQDPTRWQSRTNEVLGKDISRTISQQDLTRLQSRTRDEVLGRDISRNISQQDPTRWQSRTGDEVLSRDISRNISQQDPTRWQSRTGDEVLGRDISRNISQQDPTRWQSRTGDEVLGRDISRNISQQDPTRWQSRTGDEVLGRDISRNISQQDPTRWQSRTGDEVLGRDISRNISQQDPTRMHSRIGDEVSSRDISRDISQQDPTRMHSRIGDEVSSRDISRDISQQDPTRMQSRIGDEVSSRDISRDISQQDPTRMHSRIGDEVSSRDISRDISQQDPTRMQSRIGDEVSSRDISRDISQQDPTRMHSRIGDEVSSRDISRTISQQDLTRLQSRTRDEVLSRDISRDEFQQDSIKMEPGILDENSIREISRKILHSGFSRVHSTTEDEASTNMVQQDPSRIHSRIQDELSSRRDITQQVPSRNQLRIKTRNITTNTSHQQITESSESNKSKSNDYKSFFKHSESISDEERIHVETAVESIKKISNSSEVLHHLHRAFESSLRNAGIQCLPEDIMGLHDEGKFDSCRGKCCTSDWNCLKQREEFEKSTAEDTEENDLQEEEGQPVTNYIPNEHEKQSDLKKSRDVEKAATQKNKSNESKK